MRICFNATGCGLGNNGGTRTIVRSADTLVSLGHTVTIAARVNNYTWGDIASKVSRGIDYHADVVIAVSARDVLSTVSTRLPCVWWMRGWENWAYSDYEIAKLAESIPVIPISSWIRTKCKQYIAETLPVCFAGVDDYYLADIGRSFDYGVCINHSHKTKRADMVRRICNDVNGLWQSYGADGSGGVVWHKHCPNERDKSEMYSSTRVWFVPTTWEGFHNVAAEAALAGCHIVCADIDSNGMGDWATHETVDRYGDYDEAVRLLLNPNMDKAPLAREAVRKIADRRKNMSKFVDILEGVIAAA